MICGRLILPFLVCIYVMTGCTTLGMAKGATSLLTGGDTPSVDAELTVGDKTQEVHTDFGKRQNQQATVIHNVEEADKFLIMVAVIGWLAPGPQEIWRGFLSLFPWTRRKR